MKKKKKFGGFLVFILIFLNLLYIYDKNLYSDLNGFLDSFSNFNDKEENFNSNKGDFNYNVIRTKYDLKENISNFNLKFCPKDDCYLFLINSFKLAKDNISCAFYDLDLINLSNEIINLNKSGIDFELIVDNNYLDEEAVNLLKDSGIKVFSDEKRGTRYNNYMHNKFCIIDMKYIITGSANPTERGLYKNNNNLALIDSKYLSQNYYNEFYQMKYGIFGYKKKNSLAYNNITLKFGNETYFVENYFCPQNDCEKRILSKLNNAKDSVYFASFVLTSDLIEESLINLSNFGVEVQGVVEKRNSNSKGSEISKLNESFNIYLDKNKYTMHHKFFIIDKEWVVFGSMNPTKSGTKYNDENILIIRNKEFANKFYEEYLTLVN